MPARGAYAEGGLTIGVIPAMTGNRPIVMCRIPIATGIGYRAKCDYRQIRTGNYRVGGGYGTLTEIGYALDSKKPVIGLKNMEVLP